jgi:non-heme chloroperoxidase
MTRIATWHNLTFFAVFAVALCESAFAGQYVKVSPDLELYYEEAGRGTPIVFIPLWTGTTAFQSKQLAHFSNRYRAITYDPRGQGRSTKTLDGNNYIQHGHDLKAFMDALRLKDVVLVGHSYGCQTSYAYVRAYGIANVKSFVCIDSPPKYVVDKDDDWGLLKHPNDMKGFHDGMTYDRLKTTREFVQSMITRKLTQQEIDWFVDEMLRTPGFVTVLLDYDASVADFTAEAKMIDGKIPVLNVVADPGYYDGWTATARTWLKKNAPNSRFVPLGLHMMQWEFPDKFNAAVDAFLSEVK